MEKRGRLNRQLGANLRAIRLARGYTQEAWATHLGYDRTYVASVERGERNLTLDTLTTLADLIEVDPLELLDDRAYSEHPDVPTSAATSAGARRRRHVETPPTSARSHGS